MKTRQKPPIKNYSHPALRPAQQFLDIIKMVINISEPVLKGHTWIYRTPRIKFDILKNAYLDIEKLIQLTEHERPVYQVEESLRQDCLNAEAKMKQAGKDVEDIKNNVMQTKWENEAVKIAANIHFQELNTVKTKDIEAFRALRIADERLYQLKLNAELSAGKCLESRKHKVLMEQVEQQEHVIALLEEDLNQVRTNPAVTALQVKLEEARQKAQYFAEHKEELLQAARQNLITSRAEYESSIDAINNAQSKHYSALTPKEMHGLIRLYDRCKTYSSAFDLAYTESITKKDESKEYLQQMNACQIRLDDLMRQLWCKDFGNLTAREIYWQLNKLSQENRDKFLVELPDASALSRHLGLPAASTEDKRKNLVRADKSVDAHTMFKL